MENRPEKKKAMSRLYDALDEALERDDLDHVINLLDVSPLSAVDFFSYMDIKRLITNDPKEVETLNEQMVRLYNKVADDIDGEEDAEISKILRSAQPTEPPKTE